MDHADSQETLGLLERVRAGDRGALDSLFAKYRPYLRHVVEMRLDQRLRRRVGVSDVIQATQVDALERIDDFLADKAAASMPFRWWLRRAAHERLKRVWRENLQAAKRDMRREIPLPDRSSLCIAAQLEARGSSPSERVAKNEQSRRVRRALAHLVEADREILMMRTFEDLPYEEIGYILEIEPAAARKRHGRALLRLDELLRQGGLGESEL